LSLAFAQRPAARTVLASDGGPAQVLASLRSLGGEAGAAVSGYLDLVGNRLIDGFDIAEPTALEFSACRLPQYQARDRSPNFLFRFLTDR
jgi:hypothetical protein